MVVLLQILTMIVALFIPILQSICANTVDINNPKTFIQIIKTPLFWIIIILDSLSLGLNKFVNWYDRITNKKVFILYSIIILLIIIVFSLVGIIISYLRKQTYQELLNNEQKKYLKHVSNQRNRMVSKLASDGYSGCTASLDTTKETIAYLNKLIVDTKEQ